MRRREFLWLGAAGIAAGIGAACRGRGGAEDASSGGGPAPSGPLPPDAGSAPAGALPSRPLGRTGWNVSLVALGGQALLERVGREEASVGLIRRAVELGVNFFETAAGYGPSRASLGRALEGVRDRVFLACKTDRRDRDGAWRQIDESLKLLRTDRLDLMQIHGVSDPGDASKALGAGGALQAIREARDQGLVRFVGVTGHRDPAVLLDCIRRERFDTILMPMNPADPHHLPFARELLPAANGMGMGVLVMKVFGKGYLFREGGWLHPAGVRDAREALLYALTQPVHAAVVGCDTIRQLEENVAIGRAYRPLEPSAMRRLESATLPYAARASGYKDWGRMPLPERIRYVPFFERGAPRSEP